MALSAQKSILKTYNRLLTNFSDFLTVAIHTILYERSIYPPTTFMSVRKYNFPVRQNLHPKVCKWIMNAVAAVETEMAKGIVNRVAVVIYSRESKPLERFMFDVSSFPEVPPGEMLTELEDMEVESEDEEIPSLMVNLEDIEEQLRATVRKLAYCGAKLGSLPKGCSYTVVVELKEAADAPIKHPQPWIPSQSSLQTGDKEDSNTKGKDLGGVKSIPVRLVEAGSFVLEMWVEEGKDKEKGHG